MTDEQRQRLNVRTIRVSLQAALRFTTPAQGQLARERARELLAHARRQASVKDVIADIEALQAEITGAPFSGRAAHT